MRTLLAIVAAVTVSVLIPSVAGAQVPAPAEPLVIDHGGVVASAPGEPAPLFNLLSVRWKSHTITYYNEAKQFSGAVKKAAAAWNSSGVKITWKAVSKGAADVLIKTSSTIGVSGLATYQDGRSGLIELNSNLKGKDPYSKAVQVGVTAHEMGHIMGLDHNDSTCATMNSSIWSNCKLPKEQWLYRCRTLESDDVRGGAALFGGKPKKLGREFCPLEKAPKPVTNLKAQSSDGEIKLSWELPEKGAPTSVEVVRGGSEGDCPKGGKGTDVFGGRTGATDQVSKLGSYCYSVTGLSRLGRESKPQTVTASYTGFAPEASFDWAQYETNQIEFYDSSFDNDDDIVAWLWNFGDGSPVSGERDPVHLYPGPGSYTVTLTVADQGGHSSTTSQVVVVEDF